MPPTTPGSPGTPGNSPAESPLSPEHLRQIKDARRRRRKLDFAAGVATFNGWATAACAALTLPFALFSLTAAVATVCLAGLATVEFTGRGMLRRLDERGPTVLAANQLAFFILLTAYCLWQIAQAYNGSPELTAAMGDLSQLDINLDVERLVWLFTLAVYGGVILGSLIASGGAALFYHTRLRHLRDYKAHTPEWILQLLRS